MEWEIKEMNDPQSLTKGIQCKHLSKKYKNFLAVASLTMEVNQGDIFGFLGPNGAGKTTTIRMLCGLLSPSRGEGTVAGLDIVKDSPRIRSLIGLLPESSGYYNWMNAEEYLLHFAGLYKIDPYIGRKRAMDLLDAVGLGDKSYAPISYYSRGMKQRLGLARALINEPKIVFLDEPTLGLDPKGQQDIQKILLDLNRDKGVTIFLSSHDLSDVSYMCNRMAIIDHGILIAQGSIHELRKLVGGSMGIVITVLNSVDAETKLSKMGYRFEVNADEDSKLIDVFVMEGVQNSVNNILDTFNKIGLQLYEVRRFDVSLEEIFFRLTESSEKLNSRRSTSGGKHSLETRPHVDG
jgi:ABC-2 type transport system ATP-binding protein